MRLFCPSVMTHTARRDVKDVSIGRTALMLQIQHKSLSHPTTPHPLPRHDHAHSLVCAPYIFLLAFVSEFFPVDFMRALRHIFHLLFVGLQFPGL